MIILRQKEYSKPLTKALFRSKQAKAAVDNGVAKVSQKIRGAFLKPGTPEAFLNNAPIIKPTRQSILRDTIKTKNTLQKVGHDAKKSSKRKSKRPKKACYKRGIKRSSN